jgi:hypothetical protein
MNPDRIKPVFAARSNSRADLFQAFAKVSSATFQCFCAPIVHGYIPYPGAALYHFSTIFTPLVQIHHSIPPSIAYVHIHRQIVKLTVN